MKRSLSLAIFSAILVFAAPHGFAQPAHVSASTIPTDRLIQPADLPPMLAPSGAKKAPVVLQVGSRIFYSEAHIRGSIYAGAGSQPAGLALLEKTVAPFPKDKFIVLYCGCCPWDRCPNIAPAFDRLHDLGYSNVKVLYLPNNFGDDWVSKGYPTDK
jgi:thiosulfate/3-mercaptopyruvate sulfurtransferase